jgi:hypothetical protein
VFDIRNRTILDLMNEPQRVIIDCATEKKFTKQDSPFIVKSVEVLQKS